MSSDVDELADADLPLDAAAGEHGIPVDAVCTGCSRVAVKRAPANLFHDVDELDDAEGSSFEHVCHACKGSEWMNVVAVLHGLLGGDDA